MIPHSEEQINALRAAEENARMLHKEAERQLNIALQENAAAKSPFKVGDHVKYGALCIRVDIIDRHSWLHGPVVKKDGSVGVRQLTIYAPCHATLVKRAGEA